MQSHVPWSQGRLVTFVFKDVGHVGHDFAIAGKSCRLRRQREALRARLGRLDQAIQIGGAIGLAVLATIAATTTRNQAAGTATADALSAGYTRAFQVGAVIIALAVPIALALLRLRPTTDTPQDERTAGRKTHVDRQARGHSSRHNASPGRSRGRIGGG